MDNQQGKTPEVMASWIAGWMDGEGTYRLACDFRPGGRRPGPRISAYNTHYPTLPILTQMLDQLSLPYHVLHKQPPNNWKPQWGIEVTGPKRCLKWCNTLQPYAITKSERLNALLEWCELRLQEPYHPGEMTDRQRELLAIFK